ncbi:MAG: DNA polymerase III subunit epsilon [Legionellales bacterium]|nr:DNA polymerase III subunit epsilon [Legionellales bacterium]
MKLRQIALDTETTGLEPSKGHKIIEIGCVEMINRRLTGNNFHVYINPEREIDAGARRVHGLSNTFLADKPVFHEIMASFKNYVDGAQLIIHNAAFDVGFLNHEFKLVDKKSPTLERFCSIVDTLDMARKRHPGQKNSLDALCKRYDVDNSHRDLHGALVDADLLAQLYLAMTGGQTELFGSQEQGGSAQGTGQQLRHENQLVQNQGEFHIIKPSESELALHNTRVETIRKKAKNPHLWDNIRPLAEPVSAKKDEELTEHGSAAYTSVCEEASTGATTSFDAEMRLRKRSTE